MDFTDAVRVRQCSVMYGKGKDCQKALNAVNLTVPSGVIYALLGPSGCGKTTLLKTITGKLKVKSCEEISVFGIRPATKDSLVPGPGVGHMPQNLGLYEDLTTEETMLFFGRLNQVQGSILRQTVLEIMKVLELKFKKELIRNLSGGQQRRASLATALLHKPPLLLLDEPTVGLDPLLRKKIWTYLVNLTETMQTTIIITTHYIEEAKDANIIGAMKEGRILIEASPSLIMRTFKANNLESCFEKMWVMDEFKLQKKMEEIATLETSEITSPTQKKEASRVIDELHKVSQFYQHLNRVTQLVKRNIILRSRNIPVVLFQIFIPMVSLICYCTAIVHHFSGIKARIINEETPQNLSNQFIDNIDNDLISYNMYNFEDGIQSVVSGVNHAVLQIRDNFTDCTNRRLDMGLDVDNETLICSSVAAHFDNTNAQIYYALYPSFIKSMQSFYEQIFINLGKTPSMARLPVEFPELILDKSDQGVTEYTIPGLILMSLHFVAAGSTIIIVTDSQRNGLEERLWTSAVGWSEILLSYIISEFIFIVAQAVLLLVYVFYIYQITLRGSIFLILFLSLAESCTGMGLGFFLCSLLPRENAAAGITCVFSLQLIHCFTNGIIWPLEGMSIPLRTAAKFLPLSMPIEAFKAIMYRGFDFKNLTVILGFVSTGAWFIIYFGLSLIIFKYRK